MLYARKSQAAAVLPNGYALEAGGVNMNTLTPITSGESYVP
jgi:hypothetical protein